MEDNMTKSKTENKSRTKIFFEKLTVEEEEKVWGSATPDGICGPDLEECTHIGEPTLLDC